MVWFAKGPGKSIRPSRRREFDPQWMRAYQRTLLAAGGAVLGGFIALCACAVAWIEVGDYQAAMRAHFLSGKAQLVARMSENSVLLRRLVSASDTAWDPNGRPSQAVATPFFSQHGYLRYDQPGTDHTYAARGLVDAEHPPGNYLPLLALSERLLVSGMWRDQAQFGPGQIYVIGAKGRYVATSLYAAPGMGPPRERYLSLLTVLPREWPDVAALLDAAAAHPADTPRDVIWLPPRVDPITGERALRLANWVFDHHGQPVALIVQTMRLSRLLSGLAEAGAGEFAVLDDKQNVLLTPAGDPGDDVMSASRALQGDHAAGIEPRFLDGRFVIHDAIPHTGWELVYVYTPAAMLRALAPRLIGIGVVAGLGLALLLGVIVFVKRLILEPSYLRATRLLDSEHLNRTLIRTAPIGLALISEADGAVLLRNDAMARYDTDGEGLSERIWRAFPQSPDASAPARRRAVVRREMTLTGGARASDTHLLVKLVRVKYRGAAALLCTVIDITARKLTEQSLEEARRASDQANKAKSVFLATMSHEIRTPLNAVMGNLELMKRGALTDTQRKRLEIVESSSTSLLHILNDVLDLSKVEAGQLRIDSVPFDCAALLREIAESFRPLATEQGLQLHCTIAPDLPRYRIGDPIRIRQIVSNLLGNAIKFTGMGSVTVTANGHHADGREYVDIRVADTGIGISDAAQATIFGLYQQADESIHRRYGGTGLGLALCRRLVDAMGGEISVHSALGAGSEFRVCIPLPVTEAAAADDGGDRDATCSLEGSRLVGPGGAPLRVLAVEDHPASRLLLADQFRELGVDATIVESGAQALAAMDRERIDVVLTDLGLPDMDGWALAGTLRRRAADLPVVAMTAHAGPDERQRCLEAGILALLAKPLTLRALAQTLGAIAEHEPQAPEPERAAVDDARLPAAVLEAMRHVTQASFAAIERALAARDADAVLRELHSLSGGFLSVGNRLLAELCSGLQQVVREEGIDVFAAFWPALHGELAEALDALPAGDGMGASS